MGTKQSRLGSARAHGAPIRRPHQEGELFKLGAERPPMRLLLVRHGITVAQSGGRLQVDDPLSDEGRNQAARAATHPTVPCVSVVFVSPLRRALQTAVRVFRDRCVLRSAPLAQVPGPFQAFTCVGVALVPQTRCKAGCRSTTP